ncbi:MAG: glycosyltransferase family 2 protein [Hyphomicrobiales bacterium]|nr:glycosyltransferase family 2 protein [Hyphomicrobiales bacterium]
MTVLDPTHLLIGLDWTMAIGMFWYLLILDIPRYTVAFAATLLAELARRAPVTASPIQPLVSVIIAGHNERAVLRRCVHSLREQTHPRLEIICIDDGSTDGMSEEMRRLRDEGLIDVALRTHLRSGKASVSNLAFERARGEFIVILDVDCTFDRDAIARLIVPFGDPEVGGVSGNIGVRNASKSLITALQAVEYLITISLGKRALDALEMVTCVSGAFGAFRAEALRTIGGFDVGPGEDLDATLQLRRAGWRIRFAEDAWCLTDVPDTYSRFVNQRLRWERDALRLRMRKHRCSIDPRERHFLNGELLQQLEFVITNLLVTIAFPLYLIALFANFGQSALTVLSLVALVYVAMDLIAYTCALFIVDRPGLAPPLMVVLMYGAFNSFVVRSIRLVAYVQEWVFEHSRHDDYVPLKVRRQVSGQ